MGILSGMLIAAGIAFFSKKKLQKSLDSATNKQEPCNPNNNEKKSYTTLENKSKSNFKNRITTWIAKILGKK